MAKNSSVDPARNARTGQQVLVNARRIGELAIASVTVAGTRAIQMVAALGDPIASAAPEFTRMVTEKVEAAISSTVAVQRSTPRAAHAGLEWIQGQAAASADVATAAWRARSPADLAAAGWRATLASLEAHAVLTAEMAHLGARVFGAGLAPIHQAATRNARRLTRTA